MQPSVIIIITIASEIEDSATPSRTEQLTSLGMLMEMSAYVGGIVPYRYIRCRYCTPLMHAESRPLPTILSARTWFAEFANLMVWYFVVPFTTAFRSVRATLSPSSLRDDATTSHQIQVLPHRSHTASCMKLWRRCRKKLTVISRNRPACCSYNGIDSSQLLTDRIAFHIELTFYIHSCRPRNPSPDGSAILIPVFLASGHREPLRSN